MEVFGDKLFSERVYESHVMLRILLIDDHTLFRESLVPILQDLSDDAIVYEASDPEEALRILRHYESIDLILMDLGFPNSSAWDSFPAIKAQQIATPVVILTGSEQVDDIQRALNEGISGYLSKSCSRHELLGAIKAILAGDIYVSPHLLSILKSRAVQEPPGQYTTPQTSLSSRQMEVLELLGRGLSNKGIARELDVSEGTIKLHVSSILKSLNVRNRTEAVIAASRMGLAKTADKDGDSND